MVDGSGDNEEGVVVEDWEQGSTVMAGETSEEGATEETAEEACKEGSTEFMTREAGDEDVAEFMTGEA